MCCWLGSYSLESILRAAHFLCTTHILVGKQKDWIQGRRVDVANRVAKDSQILRTAAYNGQTATVVKLVQECGADVGAADKNGHGDTPLHLAACNGHTETVRALVQECGADPGAANKQFRSQKNNNINTPSANMRQSMSLVVNVCNPSFEPSLAIAFVKLF